MTICAVTRFQGVAEFGFERGVFDRPYWLVPSTSETRQQVRQTIHYLYSPFFHWVWVLLSIDIAFSHTGR
jgi:hypothetical protein